MKGDYTYVKKIVDAVDHIPKLTGSMRDEMVDHYATVYEGLLPGKQSDVALAEVLKMIHDNDFSNLQKTRIMSSLHLLPLLLIVSMGSLFLGELYSISDLSDDPLFARVEVEAEPPTGSPIAEGEFGVSSHFGNRMHPIMKIKKLHTGIDLKAAAGTIIKTTADGLVVESGYDDKFGYYVEIEHDSEYSTRYHHMMSSDVSKGDKLDRGHVIGKVGTTGLSTDAHLHYEVIRNGAKVNPRDYL